MTYRRQKNGLFGLRGPKSRSSWGLYAKKGFVVVIIDNIVIGREVGIPNIESEASNQPMEASFSSSPQLFTDSYGYLSKGRDGRTT